MADSIWTQLIDILKGLGIPCEFGLSDAEVQQTEELYRFRFPPDLRAFLQAGLPVGAGFPNWRSESSDSLRQRLRISLEGMLFDVEHNEFWIDDWGPRPERLVDALALAEQLVARAPALIPVYLHRMIPDRPCADGNPVFSVHQTDIIYTGTDLRDYLIHEFLARDDVGIWPIPDGIRTIEFWDVPKFLRVRWARGYAAFDNRRGELPLGGLCE
jgi:hypothetical protein